MRRFGLLAILCITIIVLSFSGCTDSSPATITPTPAPSSSAAEIGHSSSNPAPIGQAVTGNSRQKMEDGSQLTLTMVLENVTRGDMATKMLDNYSGLPQVPGRGNEFLFAEFRADLVNFTPNETYSISNLNFVILSEGNFTNATPVILFNPTIQGGLMKGETREGWVLFEIPANSTDPVIAYARGSDGSGGLWFRAY
ncbi:MAG TPA: hypothetical protein VMC84_05490 [Methanocella sp.]|uniref:hypothetical protein n=1 Tax=Methanocella sp. TaxID=2052833 RepID=UPI002BA35CAA|nr:hypothetical protein [Methanocella sp.]HTY90612.1 hypothetical protein [Methanocella sp.]